MLVSVTMLIIKRRDDSLLLLNAFYILYILPCTYKTKRFQHFYNMGHFKKHKCRVTNTRSGFLGSSFVVVVVLEGVGCDRIQQPPTCNNRGVSVEACGVDISMFNAWFEPEGLWHLWVWIMARMDERQTEIHLISITSAGEEDKRGAGVGGVRGLARAARLPALRAPEDVEDGKRH